MSNSAIIFFAKYSPFLFILILILIWFIKPKARKTVLNSGYNVIFAIFLNNLVSSLYYRPRPFTTGLIRNLTNHGMDSSFPSDHTTFALSISLFLLSDPKTRNYGYVSSVIAIFAGIARIFVGVHYPTDLIASLIISITSTLIIFINKKKFNSVNNSILNIYNKTTSTLNK